MVESSADVLHREWVSDFEILRKQVNLMHVRKEVCEELCDELDRSSGPGESQFFVRRVLRPMYAQAQVLAVRRLVDPDGRTRSLVLLVNAMADDPEVLSRKRYLAQYEGEGDRGGRELGERDFDAIAGTGAAHVPADLLEEIAEDLRDAGKQVKRYADGAVAHFDREPEESSLKWAELNDAIERISDLYTQVGSILTSSIHDAVPYVVDDWQAPFRRALFVSGEPDEPFAS